MGLQEDKAKLFGSKTYLGPTVDLEIEGIELEVRSPRIRHAVKGLGKRGAKVEYKTSADLKELILDCVYHKESGQPFFTEEDLEALEESSGDPNGIVSRISDAIQKLGEDITSMSEAQAAKNS